MPPSPNHALLEMYHMMPISQIAVKRKNVLWTTFPQVLEILAKKGNDDLCNCIIGKGWNPVFAVFLFLDFLLFPDLYM